MRLYSSAYDSFKKVTFHSVLYTFIKGIIQNKLLHASAFLFTLKPPEARDLSFLVNAMRVLLEM